MSNIHTEGAQVPMILESSFIGTAAATPIGNGVVTLLADGDITVKYPSGDKVVSGGKAGTSFGVGFGALSITSSAKVLIS